MSSTGDFSGEEVVISATIGYGPNESTAGQTFSVIPYRGEARYIRHWCGQSNVNTGIHFMGLAATVSEQCVRDRDASSRSM